MKKNIFITALLLIFAFTMHNAFAEEPSGGGFKVKLPDGLYLYQPKIKEEVFSPLFIVENGALVDPYTMASRTGKERFIRDYVEGKRFHVYIEGGLMGELNNVRIEFAAACDSDVFLPDIRGKGRYEGKPLKEAYSGKSLYVADEHFRSYGSPKAIGSPLKLPSDKAFNRFEVTYEDKATAIKGVREHLVPEMFERIKKRLEKLYDEKKVITGQRDKINFLQTFNAQGGKKALVGLYSFDISFRNAVNSKGIDAGYSSEILFSIFDNSIELVAFEDGYEPAYSLGGIFDLDDIGTAEIILQHGVIDGEKDGPEDGRLITIFSRTSSGWEEVYRTKKICGSIY